ncbi:MAG: FtsX-like permease family protein [Tannerella sp.]|jgi:putative ABC transport system permease protein|nr:FtsX-like permease family protein [Tannerella sp.]
MAATVIMVAVITGSLIIGDSVRNTLINRVKQRLGDTETIVFSKNAFFSDSLAQTSVFQGNARGMLLTDGFISDNGKLIPVMVWGVDDVPFGSARINRTLADELTLSDRTAANKDLILRLPATGMVPSGSLFVTDNYTTSIRLACAGIIGTDEGGNISLKNEQIIPCNIFVNRLELASTLKIEGKINLILTQTIISEDDIETVWKPSLSGIKIKNNELLSDRVFLQNDLVATVCHDNSDVNRVFSYMANSLTVIGKSDTIPYSFITAADSYRGQKLENNDVILSDYSATRLTAKVGDSIRITFFVSGDLKTLHEESVNLRVVGIAPIGELCADPTLSADFPGLSDVENCTDWDSDLPIDMSRITKEDEDYWDQYRSTPKAIVAYSAVATKWSNAYGCATSLRFTQDPDLSGLKPSMTGIQVIHPREAGLTAAQNSIDFTSLFLSLGFFILIAAALLMLVPLSEMIFVRREELSLLSATGYGKHKIISMLWRESVLTVIVASILGIIAGIAYTLLIITLLNTLWQGAVHTVGFTFHTNLTTLISGLVAGIAIALIILRLSIVKAVKKIDKPQKITNRVHKQASNFSINQLIIADLRSNSKRAWLSFAALASGVLIVFAVGLNRPGYTDSSQLQSATGGYALWCETSIPVYHNLATTEGRKKLSLSDLPASTEILQLLRFSADDASCLNLNKVTQPTVLGVDMQALKSGSLKVSQSIYPEDVSPFDMLCSEAHAVYPVMVDETVLLWGLQMKLGDTLSYEASNGRTVSLLLAATLHNSMFQGNLLMDRSLFKDIWNEITGSEIALIKTSGSQTEINEVKTLTERALSEYGVRVMPTVQRLREFNSVTDTYLTIFLVLGGFGLLIGIAGFIIVVRKDLASRSAQIAMMKALGFSAEKLKQLLVKESRIVPLAAIATGFALSLIAVIGGLSGVTPEIWLMALIFLLLLVFGVLYFINREVDKI